jgi:LemA protein
MGPGWIALIAIVVIGLFLAMYGVGIYNSLVRLRNRFENAFSQIEVQLKRRYDLIPNLVETVKGYMAHEKGTLEAVINARNQAVGAVKAAAAAPGDAAAMTALAGAEQAVGASLGRLFALAEAYPDLKANQNMAQLTEELTSTENKVAFARQAYNDSVTAYNTYRQSFPPVFFAGMFGHGEDAELLEFADSASSAEGQLLGDSFPRAKWPMTKSQ